MSTYLYLVCMDHNPPLTADGESGQHLYDLPQIRADIANRDTLVAAYQTDDGFYDRDDYFANNTLRFLIAHQHCQLGIRDEYDRWHSIIAEDAPQRHDGYGVTWTGR